MRARGSGLGHLRVSSGRERGGTERQSGVSLDGGDETRRQSEPTGVTVFSSWVGQRTPQIILKPSWRAISVAPSGAGAVPAEHMLLCVSRSPDVRPYERRRRAAVQQAGS